MITRRGFCRLLVVGFMAGLMNADDDEEDEPPTEASSDWRHR